MSRLLVVDDKELMRDSVATMLTRAGFTIQVAPDGKTALRLMDEKRPDAILTDLQMPGMTGIELLAKVRKIDEQLPVVLMTAFATVQTAVNAMKQGAFDYITKPFDGDELVITIRRAIEHAKLLKENAVLKSQLSGQTRRAHKPMLIGDSAVMRSLREHIARIAESQSTVLISGESGVGKEVVAASIHAMSPRAKQPMLGLNCAALSTSLLESELFGHERGAFTGADKLRKGRFELADGGTLLLDEITEIPTSTQAKLLRILQERTFERVGSSVAQKVDVRVIATTNRDLRMAVADNDFRQDLFFRLNVLPIEVPPLRARLDDLAPLCEHFLRLVADREGRETQAFDPEAFDIMQRYPWPGNVRELFNICERAAIFCRQPVIPASIIAPWLDAPMPIAAPAPMTTSPTFAPPMMARGTQSTYVEPKTNGHSFSPPAVPTGAGLLDTGVETISAVGRTLEDIERDVIVATLKRHRGHRQRTAKELSIGVRTLGLKLRKWKDQSLISDDL